jgi:hypothetical protein
MSSFRSAKQKRSIRAAIGTGVAGSGADRTLLNITAGRRLGVLDRGAAFGNGFYRLRERRGKEKTQTAREAQRSQTIASFAPLASLAFSSSHSVLAAVIGRIGILFSESIPGE